MARIMKAVDTSEEVVEFEKVRKMVRKEIEKRYGNVAKFLKSENGKEFGGAKIKIYLYDAGPVNFDVISNLSKFLGIGELTRKIVVTRNVSYFLKLS